MTDGRPRAWNSSLPARTSRMNPGEGLSRSRWLPPAGASSAPLRMSTLARTPWARSVPAATESGGVAQLRPRAQRRDTIPPKVRKAVHGRDGHWCVHCGGFFPDAMELHHRRGKGIGGDSREHTDCCCNIVSLHGGLGGCHRWAHVLDRPGAEAEGLIIPRATVLPFLLPVLVHGESDGSGITAWPTCEGEWVFAEPDGAVA